MTRRYNDLTCLRPEPVKRRTYAFSGWWDFIALLLFGLGVCALVFALYLLLLFVMAAFS